MSNLNRVLVLAAFGAGSLLADVTYTEQVHYNGGTLIDMMKNMQNGPMGQMMQGRGGQAFQDQTYTVYIKGNKQARVGTNNTTIIDLDAGTMTNINNERKTYNVRTFDEIRQQMAAMQQRMGGDTTPVEFDAKVKKTGKTKDIGGQTASEMIMTMTAKNATEGNGLKIVSDIWMVPSQPGSDDIRAFQKKAAEKAADAMGGGGGPMMGGVSKAMSALRKELANMDGIPVETKSDISGASAGGPMAAMMGGEAADPNAVALSFTGTMGNYQAGSVDDSHFAIPAGYKKAEPRQWGGPGGQRPQQPQQAPPQ
jgi:hypothetical protein